MILVLYDVITFVSIKHRIGHDPNVYAVINFVSIASYDIVV